MSILALSIDYDSCLASYAAIHPGGEVNRHLLAGKSPVGLDNEAHEAAIQALSKTKGFTKIREWAEKQSDNYSTIEVLVGSNRQSSVLDQRNTHLAESLKQTTRVTPSCFRSFEVFTEQLSASLDAKDHKLTVILNKLLLESLTDTGLRPAFDNARDNFLQSCVKPLESRAGSYYDASKRFLLFLQMWEIANKYPTEKIVFQFIDDRDDILQDVKKYFIENKDLIPSNLSLELIFFCPYEKSDLGTCPHQPWMDAPIKFCYPIQGTAPEPVKNHRQIGFNILEQLNKSTNHRNESTFSIQLIQETAKAVREERASACAASQVEAQVLTPLHKLSGKTRQEDIMTFTSELGKRKASDELKLPAASGFFSPSENSRAKSSRTSETSETSETAEIKSQSAKIEHSDIEQDKWTNFIL